MRKPSVWLVSEACVPINWLKTAHDVTSGAPMNIKGRLWCISSAFLPSGAVCLFICEFFAWAGCAYPLWQVHIDEALLTLGPLLDGWGTSVLCLVARVALLLRHFCYLAHDIFFQDWNYAWMGIPKDAPCRKDAGQHAGWDIFEGSGPGIQAASDCLTLDWPGISFACYGCVARLPRLICWQI